MLTTERLVLQYAKECVNDHRLVVIVGTGGACVADWRRDRFCGGFQFIERSGLEDE